MRGEEWCERILSDHTPNEVVIALHTEQKRRGTSLNQTVIDLLSQTLRVNAPRRNGLARFAGTWTEEQFQEFEKATAVFESVEPELRR